MHEVLFLLATNTHAFENKIKSSILFVNRNAALFNLESSKIPFAKKGTQSWTFSLETEVEIYEPDLSDHMMS